MTLIETTPIFISYVANQYNKQYTDLDGNYPNSLQATEGYSGTYNYINLYKDNGLIGSSTNVINGAGVTGSTSKLYYSWENTYSGNYTYSNSYYANLTLNIPFLYIGYNTFRDITFNLQYITYNKTLEEVMETNNGFFYNSYDTLTSNSPATNGYTLASTVDSYSTGTTGPQYQDVTYQNFVLQLNTGDYSSSSPNPFTTPNAALYESYSTSPNFCNSNNAGWLSLSVAPRQLVESTGPPTGSVYLSNGYLNGDFSTTIYDNPLYTGLTKPQKTNTGATGDNTNLTYSNINVYNTNGNYATSSVGNVSAPLNFSIAYSVQSSGTTTIEYVTTIVITVDTLAYDGGFIFNTTFETTFTSFDTSLVDSILLLQGLYLDVQTNTYNCTSTDTNDNVYPLYLVMGNGYTSSNGLYGTIPKSYNPNDINYNPFTYQGTGISSTPGVYCSQFLSGSSTTGGCSSTNSGWIYIYSYILPTST